MSQAIIILTVVLSGITSGLPCPEPNEPCLQALACNWLRTNPIVDKQVYVHDHPGPDDDPNDPNDTDRAYCKYTIKAWQFHPLTIMDLDMDGVINLHDFAILSACYVPTVVIPKPVEPNIPEPNDNAFGQICYTVGGKCHLYSDCRYLKGKEWKPCLCYEDLCLVCIARKASE